MNIFYLDRCPIQCSIWMVDRHVVQMVRETAQLLATAHRVINPTDPLGIFAKIPQATHRNHPSAVWVRRSADNYRWLHTHFMALLDEYTYRYERQHFHQQFVVPLGYIPKSLGWSGPTPVPQAMPEQFKVPGDSIAAYRSYYRVGKKHLHKWKKRPPPPWIGGTDQEE